MLGVISFISVGISVVVWKRLPRIAVVRSGEVLERFQGMKEVGKISESRVTEYRSVLDSMQGDLYTSIKELSHASSREKSQKESSVTLKKQTLERVSAQLSKKAEEENTRLTTAAMTQFNAFVQKFAEEKGYDVVLGVTLSGNVLYAGKSQDITEEIIEGLNKNYSGN